MIAPAGFAAQAPSYRYWPEPDVASLGPSMLDLAAREAFGAPIPVDPLKRLLDPAFTATTWTHDSGRVSAELPGQLHPKQREFLESAAKHRWLFWGNQVGKTTVGAIEVSLLALGRHPTHQYWQPGLLIWASALSWELWENVLLPELLAWLPADRVLDAPPPNQKSTKRTIRVLADNGKVTRIVGKAAEQGPDKYQSARVHVVWTDEEHPEAVFDEMMPRLLRFGGITINTMTPLKGLTWPHRRVYDPWKKGQSDPAQVFVSHAGLVDNPSVTPESIAQLTEALKHNPSQLASRLHGHFVRPQGLVLPYDAEKHLWSVPAGVDYTQLRDGRSLFAGIDFGAWRFAFVLLGVDRNGVACVLEELFSQRESLDARAKAIDALCTKHGAPSSLPIWGDCANPTDLGELNLALQRCGSSYRVVAVHSANKIRRAGVQRMEAVLNRGALVFRRGLAAGHVWFLGMGAGSPGVPVEGSRLLWELDNWRYPKSADRGAEQREQTDDPSDATADGADCLAALRYAVMSYWREAPAPPPAEVNAFDPKVIAAYHLNGARVRHTPPPLAAAALAYDPHHGAM